VSTEFEEAELITFEQIYTYVEDSVLPPLIFLKFRGEMEKRVPTVIFIFSLFYSRTLVKLLGVFDYLL